MSNKRKPRHKTLTMSLNDLLLFHDMCEGLLEGKPGDWAVLPNQYKRVASTLRPFLMGYDTITIRFRSTLPAKD